MSDIQLFLFPMKAGPPLLQVAPSIVLLSSSTHNPFPGGGCKVKREAKKDLVEYDMKRLDRYHLGRRLWGFVHTQVHSDLPWDFSFEWTNA